MDHKLENILASLIKNIKTLDDILLTMSRSELIIDSYKCFGLINEIREVCMSTLHNILSIELRIQGNKFSVTDDE